MSDNKKKPNPIDAHVGGRIRLRRNMISMSQEKLGDSLGITFQQIQKYEKGSNRVGASRLQAIAQILGVPVSYFFDGAPGLETDAPAGFAEDSETETMTAFYGSSEGLVLARAFVKIRDPKLRRRVVDLVKAMADGDES